MELVKIIFDGGFGGREMERLFRNYFLLSLLLKQLIFSLFITPVNLFDFNSIPAENGQTSGPIVVVESLKENSNEIWTFQLMYTLAQPGTDSDKAPNQVFK